MDKPRNRKNEASRRRWTPTERTEALKAYRASALTQEAFALQAGLSVGTLRGWIYKLAAADSEEGHLAPVRIVAGASTATKRGAITVRWPQGIEVEIALELDGSSALQLVRELLRPCLR